MTTRFLRNVFIKSLGLFLIVDLALILINPATLGKISMYNRVFPGRLRFPFGEDSAQSYNLSLFNLDAMFSSHIISAAPKPPDEYRVIVIGDSSTWGILLRPEQTLAGQLEATNMRFCGKTVRFYNLGYPTISLTKDLMVLDYAMRYQPDLIIWPVTLEAFPLDKQLSSPIVSNNAGRVDDLSVRYNLPINMHDPNLIHLNLWDRTLIGQRRALADLIRLQMFGVLWAATGIDQAYPSNYERAQVDFNTDVIFHDIQPPVLDQRKLAFYVLEAGIKAAGNSQILLVNEPVLISEGKNSDIRYNFYYPRWAYDQWREMMVKEASIHGWNYLDLWSLVPAGDFTNSAIHLTPAGEQIMTERIKQTISQQTCQ